LDLGRYRPPPAHAQAQPAQAQAQAQLCPPPPDHLPAPDDPARLVETGTGLVRPVTADVNVFTLPSTWLEKPCTLFTMEAATAAPGRETGEPERPPGAEMARPAGAAAAGRKVGS